MGILRTPSDFMRAVAAPGSGRARLTPRGCGCSETLGEPRNGAAAASCATPISVNVAMKA